MHTESPSYDNFAQQDHFGDRVIPIVPIDFPNLDSRPMSVPKEKRYTLWQLMKGIAIAAVITSALAPVIRKSDAILANPGLFVL